MAVHYAKELIALARERGHQLATIAVGKDSVWQGTVDTEGQILLLQLINSREVAEQDILKAQAREAAAAEPVTLTIPGMESPPPLPSSKNGFTPDRPYKGGRPRKVKKAKKPAGKGK